jgi:hypothetical protein
MRLVALGLVVLRLLRVNSRGGRGDDDGRRGRGVADLRLTCGVALVAVGLLLTVVAVLAVLLREGERAAVGEQPAEQ